MQVVPSSLIPAHLPNWPVALAELVRIAWTGTDGICYFPYMPFTTPEFWRESVAPDWAASRLHSWIVMHDGCPVAHAALVCRGEHWELGRLVSNHPPRGAVVALCEERMRFVRERGLRVVVECTQAHNRTQYLSRLMGLRFAGIGLLAKINGISWDIVYYDNHDAPVFVPRTGVLADPLGRELHCEEQHLELLRAIPSILATGSEVELPPRHFNVLPELVEPVLEIVRLNL